MHRAERALGEVRAHARVFGHLLVAHPRVDRGDDPQGSRAIDERHGVVDRRDAGPRQRDESADDDLDEGAPQRIERVSTPLRRSSDRSYASMVPVARSNGSSPTWSWIRFPSATLRRTWWFFG